MPMKKNVLLHGMFGGGNIGDEAVCASAIELCRSVFNGQCDITVCSYNEEATKQFTGYAGSVFRYLPAEMLAPRKAKTFFQIIRNADLLVIGGGGLFQDVHSPQLMMSTLFLALNALIAGVPVVVLGLGVGPVKSRFLGRLARVVVPGIEQVALRDEYSLDYLRNKVGVDSGNLLVTGDTVPMLREKYVSLIGGGKRGQGAVLIFRRWETLDVDGLKALLQLALEKFKHVSLLAFEDGDTQFYQDIVGGPEEGVSIIRPSSVDEACRLISGAEVVYSMRLHGCIIANMVQTPFVAFVYDRKVRSYCDSINRHDQVWDCNAITSHLSEALVLPPRPQDDSYSRLFSQNTELLRKALQVRPKLKPGYLWAWVSVVVWGVFYAVGIRLRGGQSEE